jgi:hypothetical protein
VTAANVASKQKLRAQLLDAARPHRAHKPELAGLDFARMLADAGLPIQQVSLAIFAW